MCLLACEASKHMAPYWSSEQRQDNVQLLHGLENHQGGAWCAQEHAGPRLFASGVPHAYDGSLEYHPLWDLASIMLA